MFDFNNTAYRPNYITRAATRANFTRVAAARADRAASNARLDAHLRDNGMDILSKADRAGFGDDLLGYLISGTNA